MDAKTEIVKTIMQMSGQYSVYSIFSDWIESLAICLSNGTDLIKRGDLWLKREKQFITAIGKYSQEEQEQFAKLTFLLPQAYEEGLTDTLGEIYMESEAANKSTGQFFTPFTVCETVARIRLAEYKGGKITVLEPTAGSGGMVIAMAKVIQEYGENYQKVLEVTTQDLDWKAVYMTYVQLSYLGIKAVVKQGDALEGGEPKEEQIFYTPAYKGMLI